MSDFTEIEGHIVETGLYEYQGLVYRVYGRSKSLDGGIQIIVMRPDKSIDYETPLCHVEMRFFLENFGKISDHF